MKSKYSKKFAKMTVWGIRAWEEARGSMGRCCGKNVLFLNKLCKILLVNCRSLCLNFHIYIPIRNSPYWMERLLFKVFIRKQ